MKKGTSASSSKILKPKVRRKGVHSKTKNSRSKHSKNYAKKYNGQG